MVDEAGGQLAIADPTQSLKEITVTLDGRPAKLTLPSGAMAGSTLAAALP